MAKKALQQCRKASEFVAYALAAGGKVETCGKGVKVYGPKPGLAVIHANHPRELATGTRAALIKVFIMIGLAGAPCYLVFKFAEWCQATGCQI